MKKDLLNSPTDDSMQGSGAMSQYSAPSTYNSQSDLLYNAYNPRHTGTYQPYSNDSKPAKKKCGCGGGQDTSSEPNTLNSGADTLQQPGSSNMPYQQMEASSQYIPPQYQQMNSQPPQRSIPPPAPGPAMPNGGIGVGAAPMWQQLAQDIPFPNNQ